MYFQEDKSVLAKEKAKARELRKSRWWQNRIQNTTCHYCSVPMKPSEVTMDHVLPISRGGRSNRGNVVPCCKTCNSQKRYLTPVEWQEYLLRSQAKGR